MGFWGFKALRGGGAREFRGAKCYWVPVVIVVEEMGCLGLVEREAQVGWLKLSTLYFEYKFNYVNAKLVKFVISVSQSNLNLFFLTLILINLSYIYERQGNLVIYILFGLEVSKRAAW